MTVRLTWAVPTGTITGYNITCGQDRCDSVLAAHAPDSSGRVSATLQHTANLNTTLVVFIRGVNGMDLASFGAGTTIPVATFGE